MSINRTNFPLIVLDLNEINFDLASKYVLAGRLPEFARLLTSFRRLETFSEKNYLNLEPWIQWVSAQTGLTYEEHKIFRLGDIVGTDFVQVFECLEKAGFSVGAISPMNARNNLNAPAYFIPDPWTQTHPDPSGFSRRITGMLRQTVNENASGRVSFRSLVVLAEATFRTLHPRNTTKLFVLALRSIRKPWLRSLVLDQLIHMIHLRLLRSCKPDVSFVFMNAGAHVQHHYMFSSPHVHSGQRNPSWYVRPSADPIYDMLKVYDSMLGDYLRAVDRGSRLMVATGLTQIPYEKITFYYRLRDHGGFLRHLNVDFARVFPRMTRDFEIQFVSREQALAAKAVLESLRMREDGVPLFEEIEDRGLSFFVTLTYPKEISSDAQVCGDKHSPFSLFPHVVFVAVKNGMHSPKGFAFFSQNCDVGISESPVHVAKLFNLVQEAARA